MTITEFLEARIAEDETAAGDLPADGYPTHDHRVLGPLPGGGGPDTRAWNPARVLAECEAKRRIVDRARWKPPRGMECDGHPGPFMPHGDYGQGYCMWGRDHDGETSEVLRILATAYAYHPDYDEAWRP